MKESHMDVHSREYHFQDFVVAFLIDLDTEEGIHEYDYQDRLGVVLKHDDYVAATINKYVEVTDGYFYITDRYFIYEELGIAY
jgi:hypothetical protein